MLTTKCGGNDRFRKSPFGIIVENLTRLLDKESNFQRQLDKRKVTRLVRDFLPATLVESDNLHLYLQITGDIPLSKADLIHI